MIQLPKTKPDPKDTEHLCKCRPICKSRRREWNGEIQKTSAELLLERKPLPLCFRRCPTKVSPNGPCPLSRRSGRSRRITIDERNVLHKPKVVRICQAPLDDTVETPYLNFANVAMKLGAWDAVHACCAFCQCGPCCPCGVHEYLLHDAERAARLRGDMRSFDKRVKTDHHIMRIKFDEI